MHSVMLDLDLRQRNQLHPRSQEIINRAAAAAAEVGVFDRLSARIAVLEGWNEVEERKVEERKQGRREKAR